MSLTFREQLIASRPVEPLSPELAEALNGRPCPDHTKDPVASSQWWIDAEAKNQVRRADALIAAMNAEIPRSVPKKSPAARVVAKAAGGRKK